MTSADVEAVPVTVKFVVVAFVPVAFRKVKFWRVVDARARKPYWLVRTPVVSMVSAVSVDVANVLGDAVATYKLPLMLLKVHGFEVSDVSVSASCGPVDDAMWSCHAGVVVPSPRFPTLLTMRLLVGVPIANIGIEGLEVPVVIMESFAHGEVVPMPTFSENTDSIP
jgi:hypothetical protein